MPGTATFKSTGLGLEKIKEDFKKLMNLDVLVGVPEDEAVRTVTTESEEMNNAQLIYLHTNGSDLQHIPKRPIIEPAIEAHKNEIDAELKIVGELALQGKIDQAISQLNKVGQHGQTICRDWFLDPRNGWPPNSEETILNKLRKSKSPILKAAAQYVDEGGDLSDITGLEGATQVLVDTGQLKKSITFVVRNKQL